MALPPGWTITENGWTWIGPGPQPGVDPFHVPAATTPGAPASLYYDDRAGDLQNLSKIVTNTADDSGFYVPDWLKNQGGALTPTSQAGGQAVSSYAHSTSPGNTDYFYNSGNLLDKSGGYSPYANPDLWTRIANDPAWQQAMATGNYAALNGNKTYDVLDRNGNVVDTRTFTNLDNGDYYDQIVMALVGMGFGAAAAGAMAAGGTAAGTAGGGTAATTAGTVGSTAATTGSTLGGTFGQGLGTWGASTGGAGFGLAPEVLPAGTTLAGGSGLATGAGLGGAGFGASYGLTPTLGAAAGGAAGAGSAGSAGGGSSSLINGVSNKTLLDGATTALGALGGKGTSTPDLTGDEAARQAKLQAAIDAINERFGYGTTPTATANKTSRDSMYSDISGAVSDAAMRDLNKQFTTASNRNTFGLARSGLLGGSVDAESGGDLQERYGEGKMKATQQGLGAASDLRSQDEQTRQKLVSLAQSGLDVGTANSMAASELQASADSARANAGTASVGRLFDDMSQAYAMNGYLKARYPNGVGTSAPTSYGSNLFGTTRYTGRVQG